MLNSAIVSVILEKPANKSLNHLPGAARRASEILQEGLIRCKMNKFTLLGKYRWYRSIHCGPKIIEYVRIEDMGDYCV